jgi:ATP-binding cassette, subfamily B, bacterial
MIASWHGRRIGMEELRRLSETTRTGSNLHHLARAAEAIGFRTLGVRVDLGKLMAERPLPCLLHWGGEHFVVLHRITGGPGRKHWKFHVADPAHGLLVYDEADFLVRWIGTGAIRTTREGIALLLDPTPRLTEAEDHEEPPRLGLTFLWNYLRPHRRAVVQLALSLAVASAIQLSIPFLTQSVVDVGVAHGDMHFIWLVLIGMLILRLGSTVIELIRGWLVLHLGSRISISLLSDFFIKLMKLPISFFDAKQTGDLLQRIDDHNRIEQLLTNSSLSILFSLFNLILFSAVLAWYSLLVFTVFVLGSALYVAWVLLFMKRRRDLDYKRFVQQGAEQSTVIELMQGMQEIKLHNAERPKRWAWEEQQVRLFKVSMETLSLQQTQTLGGGLLNELKNLIITVLSAKLVIDGELTLGMMLSISYIIGQLNGPVHQLIGFSYTVQDARIALERLSEIHQRPDESSEDGSILDVVPDSDITLEQVSFRYPGSTEAVLKGLDLIIPSNKTTAIVGSSGSGKTTLLKLLLKIHQPSSGRITYGHHDLGRVDHAAWRDHCGVVMQEGFIFNDTIANNIALGQERIDKERLVQAATVANIHDFISGLPLGYNTKIGREGLGMSTGQKQRILIARAVHKRPHMLLFDEATSALDASNERMIMENLERFFKDRTAVVIAHRLSTVKNADNIIVLDKGLIAEQGTHTELLMREGIYYRLIRDQLQLERLGNDNYD